MIQNREKRQQRKDTDHSTLGGGAIQELDGWRDQVPVITHIECNECPWSRDIIGINDIGAILTPDLLKIFAK